MDSELILDNVHDIDNDDLNELKEVFHETDGEEADKIVLKEETEELPSKILPPSRNPILKKIEVPKLILPRIEDEGLD
jgi:hypothetical protein